MFTRATKNVNLFVVAEVRKPFPENVFRATRLPQKKTLDPLSLDHYNRFNSLGKPHLFFQVFRRRGIHRTSSHVTGVPPSVNPQPPTHRISHRALRR